MQTMRKSPNFRKDIITHQVFEQSHRLEFSWSWWYWANRKCDKPETHRWGGNDTSMSRGIFWAERKSHRFATDEHPPFLQWFSTHFCLKLCSGSWDKEAALYRQGCLISLLFWSVTNIIAGLKGHLNHTLTSVSYPETGKFQERKQHFDKTCSLMHIISINYRMLWSFSGSFASRCQAQQWTPVAAMWKPSLSCSIDRRGD